MMELESLHALARTEEGEPLWVTYKLLGEEGRYGVLCYLEGVDPARPHTAACLGDLCARRPAAERLLRSVANHGILPAHLPDLVWELM